MTRKDPRRKHPAAVARARRLRHSLTPAEAKLWTLLRNRRLNGLKFRRQCTLGVFAVDFCCFERRVVIEVDGPSHAEDEQIEYDRARSAFLKEAGFRVLRIWNEDLYQRRESVVERILAECGDPPEK